MAFLPPSSASYRLLSLPPSSSAPSRRAFFPRLSAFPLLPLPLFVRSEWTESRFNSQSDSNFQAQEKRNKGGGEGRGGVGWEKESHPCHTRSIRPKQLIYLTFLFCPAPPEIKERRRIKLLHTWNSKGIGRGGKLSQPSFSELRNEGRVAF